MDFRQLYAIRNNAAKKLMNKYTDIKGKSGIYILKRYDGNLKYFYVGQAVNVLSRMIDHLTKYDGDIDYSLKKRGLAGAENLGGWDCEFHYFEEELLNEKEREFIEEYLTNGFLPYNKTLGGQDFGKANIFDKERKGYNKGLLNGYNKARKDIAKLFEKNLMAIINGEPNKLKEKALKKFKEFINYEYI